MVAVGAGRTERRARLAVALVFLTNGLVYANLLPRFPQVKADLGLSNTQLGLAVAAMPFAALLAGLTAGPLIARFTSAKVASFGMAVIALGVVLVGFAPSWGLFATAMLLVGAADAVVDVAQNAHGLRVQRRYGRSILNGFHALWSVGAVAGGLMGSAAAGAGLALPVHLGLSSLLSVVIAVAVHPLLLRGDDRDDRPAPGAADGAADGAPPRRPWTGLGTRTVALLAVFGLVAISGTLVEDSGATWAAVYLQGLGAGAAVAGLGFVALQGCQFVGRLVGDRVVDRFGQRAVARAGGGLVLAGMGLALAFPTVPGTVAGFGLAGFGVATLVPAAMTAADHLPGLAPGTGLTIVTWLMRVGFLISPPVVGLVADATSLRVGLLVVPLAGLVVVLLAGVLAGRRRPG
ncbi:Membrane protein mosC [Pseudonocardia sp. Ae717_Ps2]|uniref:MFS transporter n=1 Tax=unclassified Pseudonocardia TaxID=2619320 RepID=UPI00094B7298|nr:MULTISPECIES: MFS transporter [unclassified Pseudonocardia]OLM31021.1 Membrane protein mosC [Pseudonocardia sp. Ae717_Ps2]